MTLPVNSAIKRERPFWRKILKGIIIFMLVVVLSLIIFLSIRTSVTDKIDPYVYNLPYEPGAQYRIIQGYGSLFSHKNIAALDFNMPEGTPICAAREGVVYRYKDDSNEGGPFANYKYKANYIIIKHKDGSFGCYWHLKQNGVVARRGFVSKGQVIGYSGATGFLFSSHLHFSVKRKFGYEKDFFLKTKFLTSSGVRFLSMWESYKRPAR